MTRSGVFVLAAFILAGCAATPAVSRTKTTLGEVDMTGLECRRDKSSGSNIGRTICASPQAWASYENGEANKSQALLDEVRDNTDNRRLYRGTRAD